VHVEVACCILQDKQFVHIDHSRQDCCRAALLPNESDKTTRAPARNGSTAQSHRHLRLTAPRAHYGDLKATDFAEPLVGCELRTLWPQRLWARQCSASRGPFVSSRARRARPS
jgi:hypothetical protein